MKRGARQRAALFSVLLVAIVTACVAAPPMAPPVHLVIWVDNPAIGASIQQRIVPYMRDNPNVTVKVFDQFGKIRNGDVSLAIEALAGSELSPDVVALSNEDLGLMSNPDDLVDLRPYTGQQVGFNSDDFFPTIMSAFQYRGKQLAIPSEIVPWVIFYNESLFDQADVATPGLNWSIGEFVADGQRLQEATGGRQPSAGFVTDPTVALVPFAEEFGANPQDAVDDPDARWLADKQTAEALQWFADLGLRQRIMPTDPGNRSLGLWFVGRAGMMGAFMDQRDLLPSYFQRRGGDLTTPTPTGSHAPPAGWKFKWGVTMIPKAEVQTTIYYISGYGIPSESRNPAAAWGLIDYLTSHLPEQPGRAYVPSRESLARSKEFAALYPEAGNQAYIRSVEVGHPVPVWPPAAWPTSQDLEGALTGAVHPENALQALRDRVEPILSNPTAPVPTPSGEQG